MHSSAVSVCPRNDSDMSDDDTSTASRFCRGKRAGVDDHALPVSLFSFASYSAGRPVPAPSTWSDLLAKAPKVHVCRDASTRLASNPVFLVSRMKDPKLQSPRQRSGQRVFVLGAASVVEGGLGIDTGLVGCLVNDPARTVRCYISYFAAGVL